MKIKLLSLFLLVSTAVTAQVNLSLGLVGWYPFDGSLNDQSGNNNNPSSSNVSFTQDRFGNANKATHFNGTNNFIRIPNSPSLNSTNKLSIAVWVRPTGFYNGTCHGNSILMKGDADYLPGNYFLRYSPDPLAGCQTSPPFSQEQVYGQGALATNPFLQLNRWYSVVWTCDGTTCKIYVDCVLRGSGPIGSFTFTNLYDLFIGRLNDATYPYWLNGDLDDLRIYNRDLTTDEVNVLGGCDATATGGIINAYTPVLSRDFCRNIFQVEDATAFNPGDTVLMIQMKGAVIDSTNTGSFGTITDYRNCGNYEINFVKSKTATSIELLNKVARDYDIPDGKVQFVRVPAYNNLNVVSTLTCAPWDGSKGGVLVFRAYDTLLLNANIDVSGKGFRGGKDPVTNPSSYFCNEDQYYYPVNPDLASEKGESIANLSADKSFGKGAPANAGGGGNSHNSGGGGGANGGGGGTGGYNYEGSPCTNAPFDNRGAGGKPINYLPASDKLYLGGGGGAGQSNNPEGFQAIGGAGGGIAIIITSFTKSNGFLVQANGAPGYICGSGSSACHEGMGGGGAGGSVLLVNGVHLNNLSIEAKGGKGADMTANGFLRVGPGGGGGGGIVGVNSPALPANISVSTSGGSNGVCTAYSNNAFGASAGQTGRTLLNWTIAYTALPFTANIDSVRIQKNQVACDSFYFRGLGYTNSYPVSQWQWYFGDGGSSTQQNAGHTYAPGNYTVKLVITDINGCKDSITTNVTTVALTADAGRDTTICSGGVASLQASASGAGSISWSPVAFLNNPSILNPLANPPATTTYYFTAQHPLGCNKTDSVVVTVRSAAAFAINPAGSFCKGGAIQLQASGGDLYLWQPAGTLNNAAIANPLASPASTTTYTVQVTDTICHNTSNLSTTVTVLSLPVVQASRSNDIDCSLPNSRLNATGATVFTWTPAGTLSNASIANPLATPTITTWYYVTGTDAAGCKNKDSVLVKVNADLKGGYLMPTGFTPNNDGLNDCYGIKNWGVLGKLSFSIYNRWGERIFYTEDVGQCWDGTYKGTRQPSGVYVYMVRASSACAPEIFRKGTFVLIR